jgi:hypothetical protein
MTMPNYQQHMENINRRKLNAAILDDKKECWLNYSIEALKPVNNGASELIFKAAEKMKEILHQAMLTKDFLIDFSIMGGLASNTHIKNEETVDILVTFKGYNYSNGSDNSPGSLQLEDLILLRDYTKRYLKNRFPEALLDDSQPLALEMSTPSFSCNFCYYFGYEQKNKDIPSGNSFQNSTLKLLNFKSFIFEDTNPLEIASEITVKDENTKGNTRALIRVLKNLKADAADPITLTGHQITSIIYSMDDYTLSKPPGQILFLFLEVSLYFKRVIENPFIRTSLKSPDQNQLVIPNHEESFIYGVTLLKKELDSLIKQLVLEIDLYTNVYEPALL